MAKIEKLWFDSDRIWITTDEEQTLSRPLEAFPTLKDATDTQRSAFKIGRFGFGSGKKHGNPQEFAFQIHLWDETTERTRKAQIKESLHLLGQELMAV